MRMANREEIASFTCRGVSERIVIGEEDAGWKMVYLRANGAAQAEISEGESREQILAVTKHFMNGHGRVLIQNLIESSEIYLGSMNS